MADNQEKLTQQEHLLIKKHLKFYKSLESGERSPTTTEQKHFVDVCLGYVQPKTEHEIAYSKFIGIYSPKTDVKITEDINSEWAGKLQKLQEAFDNNKIKDAPNPKKKSSKRWETASKTKWTAKQNKRKIGKKSKQLDEKKYTFQKKESNPKEKVAKSQKSSKIDDRIKKNIEKDNKRSSLTEIYLRKMSQVKSDIPEYEEGYPKPGWFTDDDWKKMRGQDYADMKKHHRD